MYVRKDAKKKACIQCIRNKVELSSKIEHKRHINYCNSVACVKSQAFFCLV